MDIIEIFTIFAQLSNHCFRMNHTFTKHIISLFWTLLLSINISAQSSYRLSTDNVLPTNYIRSVVQDKNGSIWMATTSGLGRYDGYNVDFLRPTKTGNHSLLHDSRILSMRTWLDRFIWVKTRGHLYCCFDIDNDRFVDYTPDGSSTEAFHRDCILSNGDIMMLDDKLGGKRIHFADGKFTSTKVSLPTSSPIYYCNIQGNEYLVGGEGVIYKWNKKDFTKTFDAKSKKLFKSITESSSVGNDIYLNTDDGIYIYTPSTGNIVKWGMNIADSHIVPDNKGNLAIVTLNGSDVTFITPKQKYSFKNIYSDLLLQRNSEPRYVFTTSKDGNLWISTYGNGIMRYDTHTGELKSYTDFLESPYVFDIYEDRAGNIWASQENMGVSIINFGSNGAKYLYYDESGEITHANNIRLLQKLGDRIYVGNMQNNFSVVDANFNNRKDITDYNDDVTAVGLDKASNLWLGTRKSGIYAAGKNYRNSDDPTSLGKGKISDILADRKGRMWISIFNHGIDLFADGHFRRFFDKDMAELQPRDMILDNNGHIWVATSLGALIFDPDKFTRDPKAYKLIKVHHDGTGNDEIHDIMQDSKNRVWIASIGYGVLMINGKDTVNYTTSDGLSDNNVQSIVEDRQGNVWFGTDNGISRWSESKSGEKPSFKTFNFGSNNLENTCTEDNAVLLADGRLAFGTQHGIVTFDPKTTSKAKDIFPLTITTITVNGVKAHDLMDENIFDEPVYKAEKITLAHNQNSLTFYFSDFYYDHQNKSRFTYYLEGYDEEWSPLSEINFAQYKNLEPGSYTLHVRSCNASGEWNDHEATLKIRIAPPFWASWWAYLFYLCAIAAAVWYGLRNFRRINELRNKVKVENQLTEYKLRFFTNISHEFRTPLTIIKGDMERLKTVDNIPGDMKQPLFSMNKSVERMSRLVNQLLEFRKMQDDRLQLALEETDVLAFLKDIYINFRDSAENKQINYMFLPFDKSYEMYVDRSYLDKIAYNLISNALKYTPSKGEVIVSVSLKDEKHLVISVEDNGVGIEKNKQDKLFERFNQSSYSHDSIGIGLHLTAELVRVHHGEISYKENIPKGSIFSVELPTDKNVYNEEDFMVADNIVAVEENSRKESEENENSYHEMAPVPMNDITVLVAEDDNDIREFVKGELLRYFNVVVASDGQEAWEKINDKRPDLVISDVMMPRMNGYDLTRKIRGEKSSADIPVILLTALTAEDKQVKGKDAGADAYIEKPFSMNLLIATCCQLIEQRKHLKAIYSDTTDAKAAPALPEIITDEQDKKFRDMFDTWLSSHISDPNLNVDGFAESLGYGRSSFYKKVKKVIGETPNEYIRKLRMNKAAELLRDDRMTVAEVAYQVGINDPYYFSKVFKQFFGISPSKYKAGK